MKEIAETKQKEREGQIAPPPKKKSEFNKK